MNSWILVFVWIKQLRYKMEIHALILEVLWKHHGQSRCPVWFQPATFVVVISLSLPPYLLPLYRLYPINTKIMTANDWIEVLSPNFTSIVNDLLSCQWETLYREIRCITIITLSHTHTRTHTCSHAHTSKSSLISNLDEQQDFCVMSHPKHSEILSLPRMELLCPFYRDEGYDQSLAWISHY